MNKSDDGGPALCKCGSSSVRRQGHQWLCAIHYRIGQMRASAKRKGKFVPAAEQLESMAANMKCADCGRFMNWLATFGQATVVTLQHYRDGSIAFVCRSCNTRHAKMPADTYRDMPKDHKWCPRCLTARPFVQFAKDNGRSGEMKLKSWCKQCSSEAHREWRQQQTAA